jgi:hypothetical protein
MQNASQIKFWSYIVGIVVFVGGIGTFLGHYVVKPGDLPVVDMPQESWIDNLSWSPDGSNISFSLYRHNGDYTQVDHYGMMLDGTMTYHQNASIETSQATGKPVEEISAASPDGTEALVVPAAGNELRLRNSYGYERAIYPSVALENLQCPILKPGEHGEIRIEISKPWYTSAYFGQVSTVELQIPPYVAWVDDDTAYSNVVQPENLGYGRMLTNHSYSTQTLTVPTYDKKVITWEISALETGLSEDFDYAIVPVRISAIIADELYIPDQWCNVIISKAKAQTRDIGYAGMLLGGLLTLPFLFDSKREWMSWQAILPLAVIVGIAFMIEVALRM